MEEIDINKNKWKLLKKESKDDLFSEAKINERLATNKKINIFNDFVKSLELELTETKKGIETKNKEMEVINKKNKINYNKEDYINKLDKVFQVYDDSKTGKELFFEYIKKRKEVFGFTKENENKIIKNYKIENLNLKNKYEEKLNEFNMLKIKFNKIENELNTLKEYIIQNRGQFKLYLRIKPIPLNLESIINYYDKNKLEINKKIFYFDKIFNDKNDNQKIFNQLENIIFASLKGRNTNIITYGQTGSGKTYTLEGNQIEKGILFIFLEKILKILKETDGKLLLNCFEIYNEKIHDLIRKEEKEINLNFNIKKNGFVEINKSILEEIDSIKSFNDLFYKKIKKYKKYGSTCFNSNSSRSHTIYQFIIKNQNNKGIIRFIDLAGNEKFLNNNNNSDKNIKILQNESNFIKKSLTTLNRVFKYLRENKFKNEKVTFLRESKLTTLIQDSFIKENQTILILTIRQEMEFLSETKETLNFSSLNN